MFDVWFQDKVNLAKAKNNWLKALNMEKTLFNEWGRAKVKRLEFEKEFRKMEVKQRKEKVIWLWSSITESCISRIQKPVT